MFRYLRVGVGVVSSGLRFELTMLCLHHSPSSNASVSMRSSRVGLELSRLTLEDRLAVDTSISSGRSSLALEFTRLDGPVITEGRHLGLGLLVSLVGRGETTGYLGGGQSLLSQNVWQEL